jgi:hypothetical protein
MISGATSIENSAEITHNSYCLEIKYISLQIISKAYEDVKDAC